MLLSSSAYHGAPLKLHLGGGGWNLKSVLESYVGAPKAPPSLHTLTRPHNRGRMYDSVFVLSSGRVTSVGPQGEFNWQVRYMSYLDYSFVKCWNPLNLTKCKAIALQFFLKMSRFGSYLWKPVTCAWIHQFQIEVRIQ